MGDAITSQISFSKLLSHTFPGIFVAIGAFMIIHLMLIHEGINGKFFTGVFEDWKEFVAIFGGLIFFGTIIGVVIDSIHHLIEMYYIEKKDSVALIKKEEAKVFEDSNGNNVTIFYFIGLLPLEKYQYFTEDYYSYTECDLNLSISFFISAFIYGFFLFMQGFHLECVLFTFLILIILSLLCYWCGEKTYLIYKRGRIDFIKGAKENLNFPSKKIQ